MRIVKNLSELYKIVQPDFLINIVEKKCYNTFNLNSKKWSDIGIDDLDIVEIIMDMEKEYNIEINDNILDEIGDGGFYKLYSNLTLVKRNNMLEKLGI